VVPKIKSETFNGGGCKYEIFSFACEWKTPRKTRIFQLEDGMDVITGDARLKEHITSYYKNLFGPPENNQIFLDEQQTDDITQVTTLEN